MVPSIHGATTQDTTVELWPLEGSAAQQTWRMPARPRCACVLFASASGTGAPADRAPAVAVGCANGALVVVYPGILQPVTLLMHEKPLRYEGLFDAWCTHGQLAVMVVM